jgi:hypothetical protein
MAYIHVIEEAAKSLGSLLIHSSLSPIIKVIDVGFH